MMKTATTILVAAAAALIALVGTTAVSAMQVPAHPHLGRAGQPPMAGIGRSIWATTSFSVAPVRPARIVLDPDE
jgi:hypothetical protein